MPYHFCFSAVLYISDNQLIVDLCDGYLFLRDIKQEGKLVDIRESSADFRKYQDSCFFRIGISGALSNSEKNKRYLMKGDLPWIGTD